MAPGASEVYDVGAAAELGYWRPPATSGANKPPCFVVASVLGTAGVFALGHVHWLASSSPSSADHHQSTTYESSADCVMSFSAGDEAFTTVPLPPRARRWPARLLKLTTTAGRRRRRLALVSYGRYGRQRRVWILDHAGGWLATTVVQEAGVHDGDLFLLYEESLEPVGRPYEDVLLASTFAQALSMALCRLPARALGRIKSVSRSWRAVIESDRFAVSHNEHHRRRSAAASSSSLAHLVFTCSPPDELVPLASCLASSSDLPPLTYTRRVFVSKPCHGLALVISCRGWCHLFNPITRAHRDLGMAAGGDTNGGSIGLGYDHSRQEHVLVLLTAAATSSPRGRMECRVWRLRDDVELARPPAQQAPPLLPAASVDVPPVFIDDDGRIYWMCRSPRAILAFGILAEAFDVVPAPPPPPPAAAGGATEEVLVGLKATLCVVQSCRNTETMTIWGGSSCREERGWTREYVVQLQRWPEFSPKKVELVIPMAVEPDGGGGRILLDTGRSLGYYDPVQRTLETVYSLRRSKLDKRFFVAALWWEETLVRPYDRCERFQC